MALLKKYIKQAQAEKSKNVFKKAWALQKGKGATISQKKRSVQNMANKKSSRKSYKRSSGFGLNGLSKPLMAGVTYAFIQPIASNLLSKVNIGVQDEIVQIGAALLAKKFMKNQIVNNWADAAIIVNTASLVSGFSANMFSGNSNAGSQQMMVVG